MHDFAYLLNWQWDDLSVKHIIWTSAAICDDKVGFNVVFWHSHIFVCYHVWKYLSLDYWSDR